MNEHILIVDDERELAELVSLYLTNAGFRTSVCPDGASALALVRRETPDLALLDVMLPDMSGFDICREIRKTHFFPIIMLTAKIEDNDKILGLTLGADDYITKPFNPLEVVARAAADAETRKNDLIMYLAHDLKTPLASVIGYLQLLRDEPTLPEEARTRYLATTLRKAERLDALTNEFFEITRFNLSEIPLAPQRMDLSLLLEQLVFEAQPQLAEKNLTAALHTPEQLPLRADPAGLSRVFDNLLRNAILYSWPDTEIDITATADDERATIRFTNQGDTIPPEKLSRLFEQFFRLDASRATSGGAGLGLAIARAITRQHGGDITAESANDRVTFTVTLPTGM